MEYCICSTFKIDKLRDFQLSCLNFLREEKNTFVSYPTGSGKSLCYETFPLFCSFFPSTCYCGVVVIVIEPLIAIMNEQVSRLTSLGFSATAIGKGLDDSQLADIASGKYTFVFSNPETLLGDSCWRNMLTSTCYQERRILLVIDEVHTAVEW
jgi:superfamily II DNA helicase RecQ